MYSIVFVKGHGNSGGLGDRIVGIFNVMSFARIFKQDFSIIWDFDISPIFKDRNMRTYDTPSQLNITRQNLVDMFNHHNHVKWSNILETCSSCPFPFPSPTTNNDTTIYFRSNITTSQYLYKNPKYSYNNYEQDLMNMYKSMYKDMFIPTDMFLNTVNDVLGTCNKNMIGIQIRTGDNGFYDDPRKNVDKYNPVKDDMITHVLTRIKEHADSNMDVYITSDNNLVIEKAKELFDGNVKYNLNAIVHIDLSKDRNITNLTNLFVDHYILSKKCNTLYVSDYSNFGTSIALCSDSTEVYNLRCEKVCKTDFLYNKKRCVI